MWHNLKYKAEDEEKDYGLTYHHSSLSSRPSDPILQWPHYGEVSIETYQH